MKMFCKRVLVISMIIVALLPCLFSSLSNAEGTVVNLTVERAGNYAANFAINFFENWSSNTANNGAGEIKTEYDTNNSETTDFNKNSEKYKLSNKSFINFVYKESLKFTDINQPIIDNKINEKYGDIENFKKLDEKLLGEEIVDIYDLMNSGKILPGDILISTDGMGKEEYLLYVGGTKIIYASPTYKSDGTIDNEYGALKYDYMQYYLRDIKEALIDEYREEGQLDEEVEIPVEYGIKSVYRIAGTEDSSGVLFTNIPETSANLIYNQKGYYNPDVKYQGIPENMTYDGTVSLNIFEWIFNALKQLVKFLINYMTYGVRMIIVGWISLIESIVQSAVLRVGGAAESNGTAIDTATGFSALLAVNDRVTIESLFYNKVPILDANFFDFENAGKYSLLIEDSSGNLVPDDSNVVYQLRKYLATIYNVLRDASIAILLVVLLYLGIRLALTTISEKKAEYKKLLLSWVTAFAIVMFIHLFMYGIFMINDSIINICEKLSISAGTEAIDGISEASLYEAVRTKAYAFSLNEGIVGIIFYIIMVYLLIRYIVMYFKRVITIYILALSGSIMGIKYALDKIGGKKTSSFGKWIKEFSFNVILQSVHAIIYTILMAVALKIASTSFVGVVYSFVILNVMIGADKIFMKIFGIDKASSLADVNQLSTPLEFVYRFQPLWRISKVAFNKVKGLVIDKDGIWFADLKMWDSDKDNIKDAKKEVLKKEYAKIAKRYEDREDRMQRFEDKFGHLKISRIPIRIMSRTRNSTSFQLKRLLGEDVSLDTKKGIMKEIKLHKEIQKREFRRGVATTLGLGSGIFYKAAAVGQLAENPESGIVGYFRGKGKIDKYRTKGGYKGPVDEHYKLTLETAKSRYAKSRNTYETFRKKYMDSDETFRNDPKNQQRLQDLEHTMIVRQEAYKLIQNGYGARTKNPTMFGDLARNYQNLQAIDAKQVKDAETRLKYFQKLVKEEANLNRQMAELKELAKQDAQARGISEEQAFEEMTANLSDVLLGTKKSIIRSGTVKTSIAEVLAENSQTELTKENAEELVEIVERRARNNPAKGRDYEIRVDDKVKIEDAIILEIEGANAVTRVEAAIDEILSSASFTRRLDLTHVDSGMIKSSVSAILKEKMKPISEELASKRQQLDEEIKAIQSELNGELAEVRRELAREKRKEVPSVSVCQELEAKIERIKEEFEQKIEQQIERRKPEIDELTQRRQEVELSASDFQDVIESVSRGVSESTGKEFEFTAEEMDVMTEQLKYSSVIDDGLSRKSALKTMTAVLGNGEVLQPDAVLDIQSSAQTDTERKMAKLYKEIASSTMRIEGLNEQSKVATKKQLVNKGKVLSNARKKNGGK